MSDEHLTHFVLDYGCGHWTLVCMPMMREMHAVQGVRLEPIHRSDDPRAVTCPACKASNEFKRAMATYL